MSSTEPNWEQFIPDIEAEEGAPGKLEGGIEALRAYGIINAYQRWCGKSAVDASGRTESIMVSCPKPEHPDTNPSAWLNSEKDLWFCGGCQEGGDIIDLGAYRYGYAVPDYKVDARFPQLLATMLEDIGVDVEGLRVDWKAEAAEAGIPADEMEAPDTADPNDSEYDPEKVAALDWKSITTPGSFLDQWMQALGHTRVPDEYLYFMGLTMVGLAIGRQRTLKGAGFPVYPNLMVTLVGATGVGKSLGVSQMKEVVRRALPYEEELAEGVSLMGRPGSGESLIDWFSARPLSSPDFVSVRGLIDVDELSALMYAAKRKGSTLKETFIGLYDGSHLVTRSRGGGQVEARDPFLTMVAGIQPEALSKVLDDQDVAGGFVNRLCFVNGTPKPFQKWGTGGDVDLTGLDTQLQTIAAWAGAGRTPFAFTASSIDEWEALRMRLEKLKGKSDMYARLELHAMKLAMIVAANDRSESITDEHVARVEKLIDFLTKTGKQADQAIGLSENEKIVRRIFEVVGWYEARRGRPPSANDICGEFSPRMKTHHKGAILEAINRLDRAGQLISLRDPKSGKKRYRVGID